MSNIGANPNSHIPRDLDNKELKNKLGIEKITEVENKRNGKAVYDIEDNAPGNGKDEIIFQAGRKGKLYLAEGVNMDIKGIGELYNDEKNPLKFKGKEIGVGFIDDDKMELNERRTAFDIDGIKEVTVPLQEAINKTHRDGIDQVFFRADGKQYVAHGKDMFMENFEETSRIALAAGDPILFNGKEISVNFIDDEANTFGQGFGMAQDKMQGLQGSLTLVSATAGLTTAGPIGLALYPVITVATTAVVGGTIGAFRGMFNKPDSSAMDSITKPVDNK